jgi:hypothetical protein
MAVAAGVIERKALGAGALDAAGRVWLVVTIAGQAVFLCYILGFYAGPTLTGNFEAWTRQTMLLRGYVPGDTAGNLAFAAHVMLAAVIVFAGTLQFFPQIRARALWLHRWNGRVFLSAAMLASVAGLHMTWLRGPVVGGVTGAMSITLNAVLVLAFAGLAWRAAARRDIASHRRWAMRAFMVTNGVFFLRLIFPAWVLITRVPPSALLFDMFSFGSYLAPLAVLEIYLRARDGGAVGRYGAAGLLFACAAYMAVGVVGFYFIFAQRVLG